MAVARELSITYGSLALTVANKRYIDGGLQINKGYEKSSVIFSFVISQATAALFAAEVVAVEAAFRIPFKDLTITQSGETLLTLSHASNTGMNAMPVIKKAENIAADTGRSRRYTVEIGFEMPADNAAAVLATGLRESTIDIKYMPSGRRTVMISGIFTALASNTARDQYEATIGAYATSVLTGIGGDYELAERPRTDADGPDKLLSFTHIYEELIFDQANSSPDDAELFRQQFSLNLIKNYPGDTPEVDVKRMVTVMATYNVWVDKTVTDLKTKWEDIKTWIVDRTRETFSISSVALIDENVNFDNDNNQISATLTMRGAIESSTIIEEKITYTFESTFGNVLVAAWSGDPLAKYKYQGPATKKLTINIIGKLLGEHILQAKENMARASQLLAGNSLIQVSSKPESIPQKVGKEPYIHVITEFSSVDIYEAYNPVDESGGTIATPLRRIGATATPKLTR